MLDKLDGKWVLVTGAASGIGHATALAFAEAGAHLVLSDLQTERLAVLRASLVKRGTTCIAETVDVSQDSAMQAFAERVHSEVPALDVPVNNAGIGYVGPFLDTPLDAWRRVLDINVMGVVRGCRHFLPPMQQAGGARHRARHRRGAAAQAAVLLRGAARRPRGGGRGHRRRGAARPQPGAGGPVRQADVPPAPAVARPGTAADAE